MDTSALMTVYIEDEEYRLDRWPSPQSKLVQECRKDVLRALVLNDAMQDLGRIGTYIRIAYNSVANADNHTEIQIKIHKIGQETSDLFGSMATTFSLFSSGSRKILGDLCHCYKYFINGSEYEATSILQNYVKRAKKLSQKSKDLRDELRKLADEVKTVHYDTMRARGDTEKHLESCKRQLRMKEHELSSKKMKMDEEIIPSNPTEPSNFEAFVNVLNKTTKIIKPIVKQGIKTWCSPLGIADVIMDVFRECCTLSEEADEVDREKKKKHMEAMKKMRDNRIQMLQQLRDLAESIRDTNEAVELSSKQHDFLDVAVTELRKLAVIMDLTAKFWDEMRHKCKNMDLDKIVSGIIEMDGDRHLEERLRYWKTDYFKGYAVAELAKWVALKDICIEGAEQIKITQQDLIAFLRENFKREEGLETVRELAGKLADDAEKELKQLENESRAHESEYQQLLQCSEPVASLA